MSAELTTVADPVKDSFVDVPNATTMVSLKVSESGVRVTFSVFLPSTGTSREWYPSEENIRIPSDGTVIVNKPSASVLAPVMVPFS